jgi:hypothetical protein
LRTKAAGIIIIGFIIAVSSQFIAAIDAPHNESNTINCGKCHGQTLLNSPFWTNSEDYDIICTRCHTELSGSFSTEAAPYAATHANKQCRNCHDPHYQWQKMYKNTDANNLFLAQGKITSCEFTCPVCPHEFGTTTLTYSSSSITYKPGWDAEKLNDKTVKGGNDKRSAILFPNLKRLGYSNPIIAVDTPTSNTITVKGNAAAFLCPSQDYKCDPLCCDSCCEESCTKYPNCDPCPPPKTYSCTPPFPTDFAAIYGQYIKDVIDVSGTNKQVKSYDRKGINSFADGDTTYNGVCEVCHTQTKYHKNDGTGEPHYPAVRCTICHSHVDGFAPSDHTGGSGADCEGCHGHDDGWNGGSYFGTTGSHSTHTENDSDDLKGPFITCDVCHDTNNYPYFADGATTLAATTVCDNCHSLNGAFDGVNDAVIGAKNNWDNGVYTGSILKVGKEKWCAGCHDDQAANSKADGSGVNAPNVIGDNSTYGFYATGHGEHGWVECLSCHNACTKHIDHKHRTYASASNNYQAGYRLAKGLVVPRPGHGSPPNPHDHPEDFALCGDCHNLYEVLGANEEDVSHTNFRKDDGSPRNDHYYHIKGTGDHFDSDWDCVVVDDSTETCVDSTETCITCHNVHGSPSVGPMLRHGELISTYGTTDKVPALNFSYLPPGAELCNSTAGSSVMAGYDEHKNGVCHACHTSYTLNRTPYLGPKVLTTKADPDPAPRDGETDVVLTAVVLDHNNNVSSVTIDLTNIGGGPGITMYDDGDTVNHGDKVSGDGTYSCKTTIPGNVNDEVKSLPIEAADPDGPTGTNHLVMTVKDTAVVDNMEGTFTCAWGTSTYVPGYYGANYNYHTTGVGTDTFTWTPNIPTAGSYKVYAWWTTYTNRATNAPYTIYYNGGSQEVRVNQQTNGGQWNLLGTYDFAAGTSGYVVLSDDADGIVIADAIKFELVP